jgi:hypothetical protein
VIFFSFTEDIEFFGRISDVGETGRIGPVVWSLSFQARRVRFDPVGVEAASFALPVLGLAGTLSDELLPTGTGAVMAKDLSKESIGRPRFLS